MPRFLLHIGSLFLLLGVISCSQNSLQDALTGTVTPPVASDPTFKQSPYLIEIISPSVDDTVMMNQSFVLEAAVVENPLDNVQVQYVQFELISLSQSKVLGFKSTPNFAIPVTVAESGNRTLRATAKLSDGSSIFHEITLPIQAPQVVNQKPTAVNDAFTILQGSTLNITANSLLMNDTDPDGDILEVVSVQNAVNGTVSKNGNTITFVPTNNFHGNASFTYTITDGDLTDSATVNITVTQVVQNQAPVANPDSFMINQNTTLTTSSAVLLANDMDPNGDPLTLTQVFGAVNGVVSKNGNTITFVPTNNFHGTASFGYTISDGSLTASTTVTITVNQVVTNQAPIAVNDSYTTAQNTTLTRNSAQGVLANDSDPNLDMISVVSNTNPANGTLNINSNGSFTFTPVNNFTGTTSFTYTISDGALTASATVTITVTLPAPSMPSNLSATGIMNGSGNEDAILFSWSANPANQNITNYQVRINGGSAINKNLNTNHTFSNLTPGQTYTLEVRAVNATGNSAYASIMYTLTQAPPSGGNISQGCNTNTPTVSATNSSKRSVMLCANVSNNPPSINLRWANVSGVTKNSIAIKKRVEGTTSWGSNIATPNASSTNYTDTNVSVGTAYEYKVEMATSAGTAYGYILTGIQVPALGYQGKIVLVIDNTFQNSLASQITTLQNSLLEDGWIPVTRYVSRTTTAPAVKSEIMSVYNSDPANVKSVLLLGRVPVPFSGSLRPDGHSNPGNTAWPADAYYGDVNTTWTQGGGSVWNAFGFRTQFPDATSKFSHSTFPGDGIELQVGRIDLSGLGDFSQNEQQLLQTYLTKLLNFKKGLFIPQKRALIIDNFQGISYLLDSRSTWTSFSAMVEPQNITAMTYSTPFYLQTNGSSNSYLWGFGSGGGNLNSADNIGTSAQFASTDTHSVFNIMFGSYFGEWDTNDNLLRSVIASGKALTNVWGGAHLFYSHHMGLGRPIGTSIKATQNNTDANYNAAYSGCCGSGNVYMALMGDPTLRLHYPNTPSNLNISNNNGKFQFSWTASPATGNNGVQGYHIFEITNNGITKINGAMITGTSFTSNVNYTTGKQFMVRGTRLEVTPSGAYENLSLGSRQSN